MSEKYAMKYSDVKILFRNSFGIVGKIRIIEIYPAFQLIMNILFAIQKQPTNDCSTAQKEKRNNIQTPIMTHEDRGQVPIWSV